MGPFSLEDLKKKELQTADLVWVIDESTGWQGPNEIEELKPETISGQNRQSQVKVFASRFFAPTSQVSWFLVVVAVLMFDFFILKAIVQGFNYVPSDFVAIKNALKKDPPSGNTDNNYQNALVKEIISASDTGQKLDKSKAVRTLELSLADLKKLLEIKTNNYHVVSSGGIDELELTVFNNSALFIEAVTVQVDYLENRGHLVQTKAFTTNFVKPKSSKTIHIPANTKGSKIKYRITNVKSSECISRISEA